MNKTDTELAVEFVIGYVNAWNNTEGATPFTFDESLDMIEKAYTKISSLTSNHQEEGNEVMY